MFIKPGLKSLQGTKVLSFLRTFVNYGRKKFYKIGPDRVWHLIFGGDDYPDEDHLRSAELFNWKTGKEPLLKGKAQYHWPPC